MANALFDVDYGLRVGNQVWFSGNGDIVSTGNITVGNIVVSGAYSVTNTNVENTTLLEAVNFSTGNAFITGGSIGVGTNGTTSPVANVYATTAYFTNFSTANGHITGSGTSVGVYHDETVSAVAKVYATTAYLNNLSAGNIYQASTQSIQTSNVAILGGNIGMGYNKNVSAVGNVYATIGLFTNMSSGNITMTGDITQSTTGTFTYAANTLPPKQYVDVMTVVFGY